MRIARETDRLKISRFLLGFGEDELPDERVSFDGLYDGGDLIGLVAYQDVRHVGPFWLLPHKLNGTAGALLVRRAIETSAGKEIHVVAMDDQTAEQCRRMGMREIEGRLFIRE